MTDSAVGLASWANAAGSGYADLNEIRELIRGAVASWGAGAGTGVSCLADLVPRGGVVLLKPNWVLHLNKSGAGMECMVTHPSFILATVRELADGNPGQVVIADAPIQSARFDLLTPIAWREAVQRAAGNCEVRIVDLRNAIATYDGVDLRRAEGLRPAERFVEFDLGRESALEEITERVGQFRNTSYDPDDMARSQGPGLHRYVLCKEVFEAGLVLNLPKLKAHAKAGVTAALKNLVGVNGDKNCLPHHRVGGSTRGGDCYEGFSPAKRMAERVLDAANRRTGSAAYVPLARAAGVLGAIGGGDLEGKWWGNDTTWRMVHDLNRLCLFGSADGVIHSGAQRTIYTLTDAIVAGERNGPLAPEPKPLGAVTFASNSAHADAAHLALMRFDSRHVSLVERAFDAHRYPLTSHDIESTSVVTRGHSMSLAEAAAQKGVDFRPPDGWKGHLELGPKRIEG